MQSTEKRERIFFILDSLKGLGGGTESQFLTLIRSLDRSRFKPCVIFLRGEDLITPIVSDVSVEILGVHKLRSWASLRAAFQVAWRAKREGVSIAHLFFNDVSMLFPPFLRLAGCKVIVSRRDLGFWYTPATLYLLRFMRHFVHVVVCNSEAVKNAVSVAEHYPRDQILVIKNGFESRSKSPSDRLSARQYLQIAPDVPVVTMVANIRPLKRFDDAIRAIGILRRTFPDILLLVVGDGSDRCEGQSIQSKLEELAHSIGASANIRFLGMQRNPMPYIVAANACLLCSETEGLSNSIIEYMMAGRSVVCTDVGGNSELIEDGKTGYLVPVGDVPLIAARLESLLTEVACDEWGMKNRLRATRDFSMERMLTGYQKLYAHLAQDSSRP